MTQIWTRRPTILEPRRELVLSGPRMRGFFKMEAVRPDGRRRLLADWFPNLITNDGLNVIGSSQGWLGYCRVGTGTTTPAVTDSALASHLAETANRISFSTSTQIVTPPYYGSATLVFRFGAGAAAGNLAEVGMASDLVSSPSDKLFSRALILDSSGDPTTITILSDEYLDVTYQLRYYPPASDVVHTVTISGTDYTVTERASKIGDANWWGSLGFQGGFQTINASVGAIAAATSEPAGTASGVGAVNASYGTNNLYRDATATFGLDSANFTIQSFIAQMGTAGGGGLMQIGISPSLVKTSSQLLALTFRHSWGRGQS